MWLDYFDDFQELTKNIKLYKITKKNKSINQICGQNVIRKHRLGKSCRTSSGLFKYKSIEDLVTSVTTRQTTDSKLVCINQTLITKAYHIFSLRNNCKWFEGVVVNNSGLSTDFIEMNNCGAITKNHISTHSAWDLSIIHPK